MGKLQPTSNFAREIERRFDEMERQNAQLHKQDQALLEALKSKKAKERPGITLKQKDYLKAHIAHFEEHGWGRHEASSLSALSIALRVSW